MNPGQGPFPPATGAAPLRRRVIAQAGFDARIMLRNGEQVLLTLVLPALALLGLTLTEIPDLGPGLRIDLATAGVLALAVISTSFTGQAIGTGFDRRYGVLRLLGTTPLGRSGLLAGRIGAVLIVEAVQLLVLGGLAVGLGWRPSPGRLALAVLVLFVGTATFVALGLLLAGTLRAEAVLAGANLLWVLLLVGGGVVVPGERLGPFAPFARFLPSGALGDATRAALIDGRADGPALLILTAWGVVAAAAAVRWFRWD